MKTIDIRSKKERYILTLLIVFLSIGMIASIFLIYEHFSPEAGVLCNFGESLNCNIVNTSPYANLDGLSYLLTIDLQLPIPLINLKDINVVMDFLTTNAFLGFLTLLFVLFLAIGHYKRKDFLFIKSGRTLTWMKGVSLFSLIYAFYLLMIQHFILKTYCVFCLLLDLIIILAFILSWFVMDESL